MARDLLGGIDLGGTKIQAVVVGGGHEVRGQSRRPTPTEGGPQDVVEALAAALREAAEAAGVRTGDLAAVGIGSPGEIDGSAGTVTGAGNLPGWRGTFALAPALSGLVGAPVALGNDVQVATDAEAALGAAQDFSSLLGVFWGTGVGGGIVLDGRPWLGRGAAGEIGHVVVKIDGAQCPCGRRGCMEAYAGRRALEERARRRHDKGMPTKLFEIMEAKGRTRLTSGVWAKALEQGDELATKLIDEAVEALGCGVASACNVLDVECVVIGGGLGVRLGEPYAERIAEAMRPHLFFEEMPVVRTAQLGDLGGAIGAALLARTRAGRLAHA
jgi:glucokinase